MNIVVIGAHGDPCGACREPIQSDFGFFDTDLKAVVCAECRYRMMVATSILAHTKMHTCVQISGNKPIK